MLKPKPLVKWYGGKARMAQIIAEKLPHHKNYVEPFGGAAGVLMAKSPSYVEVYNDLHSGIVNLFKVVRDPIKCEALLSLLELTPYSREEWKDCNSTWELETNEIEKARKVYVTLQQNFVGNTSGGSWGFGGKLHGTSKAQSFCTSLKNVLDVSNRLRTVLIENSPALNVMEQWDSPDTLIYADPPYLPETRIGGVGDYKFELNSTEHSTLLDFFLNSKSKIVLSGYQSNLYSEKLERNGWVREDFSAFAASCLQTEGNGLKGKAQEHWKRTECLWFSPNAAPRTLWNLESEAI